jgi:acetyltransferase-like isoleucine patch superfamily enzyme
MVRFIRSFNFRLNQFYFKIVHIKYKWLYKGLIVFGKQFKSNRITFEMHPENPKLVFGDNVQIRKNATFRIGKNSAVSIGEGVFFNQNFSLNAMGTITIGNDTIFGEDVKIYDHNHGFKNKTMLIKEQPYSIGRVDIGSNCWIGSNVVILKDVKIGDNCIVGANTLVTKDISPNTVIYNKVNYITHSF